MAEKDGTFTAEERAREQKAAKRGKTGGTADLLAKITEMSEGDRAIAERVHELVMSAAPDLTPRTWYEMPAYALDGKVVVFFQDAGKFKARYATLGFQDTANLDDGPMWPTSFAIDRMTKAVEKRIVALAKKAVG